MKARNLPRFRSLFCQTECWTWNYRQNGIRLPEYHPANDSVDRLKFSTQKVASQSSGEKRFIKLRPLVPSSWKADSAAFLVSQLSLLTIVCPERLLPEKKIKRRQLGTFVQRKRVFKATKPHMRNLSCFVSDLWWFECVLYSSKSCLDALTYDEW